MAIEPNIALLRLAEFLTVGFGNQRASEGKGFVLTAEFSTDQFRTGRDVSPLVATAHLQATAFCFVEVQEVVALKQLVSEFRERHAFGKLAIEASLHAIFGHHIVDGNALTDLTCEIQEGEILHPIVIVDQLGRIGGVTVEIEEASELLLDAGHIVSQRFLVEQVALSTFTRRVADHAGGSSHKCQRFMPGLLQVAEHHHATKVADVQRVSSGVDTHVGGDHALVKEFFGAGHHLVDHAAPFEFFYEIHAIVFGSAFLIS